MKYRYQLENFQSAGIPDYPLSNEADIILSSAHATSLPPPLLTIYVLFGRCFAAVLVMPAG